jgi:hypothetical protein
MKINVSLNFATMVTEHGKTRAYFLQDNETSNMSLQQWRSNNRPFALSMHITSFTKRNSNEYGFKDWELARKQKHLKAFLTYTNSVDFAQL